MKNHFGPKLDGLEVLIKVPDGWFDPESPSLWASRTIMDVAEEKIADVMVEAIFKKNEHILDDVVIDKERIKSLVEKEIVSRLADRAMEKI